MSDYRTIAFRVGMLSLAPTVAFAQLPPDQVSYGIIETRDLRSTNGRSIRITSLGALAGIESQYGFEHLDAGRGGKEGYVISYEDSSGAPRTVFNVNTQYSRVLGGARDIVPVVFRAKPSGTVIPVGVWVRSTATAATTDGLLYLTHTIDWKAGTGQIRVSTTVATPAAQVRVAAFKRHIDVNLDSGGVGTAGSLGDFAEFATELIASIRCSCPPGPPPEPWSLGLHTMSIKGAPQAAFVVKSALDDSELLAPAPGGGLVGARTGEDNQVTLVWNAFSIGAGLSRSFTTEYQVD